MQIYSYIAKNEHSETVKGKVEARNKNQAVEVLRGRGLFVVDIKDQGDDILGTLNSLTSGVKHDDIVNLTRQLSTMVAAGLPLTEALSILEQQGKPSLVKMLGDILREVESGKTFADSLSQFPKQFDKVYIQLIKAGESAGVLEDVLKRLADNLEKNKEFKAKVKGALIYPVIVVVAMVVVAMVMMIFVIPKLTDMYADFDAELPLATRALIGLSDLVASFWWIVAAVAVGAGLGIRTWARTKEGARKINHYVFKIPIYGKLRKKIILTEISRTLSLLLGAGISLIQALFIVADVSDSILYKEEVEGATKQVEKGIPLAQALNNQDLFPMILSQMISVGEETGKLDEVLLKLSTYFQSESEHEVKNLTTAIEPIIMIVLGLGVALMAVAIIMPIYNLTSQF